MGKGRATPLSQAVTLIEEFADDWLADTETVLELSVKWGVGTTVIKTTAVRLGLPARKRGAKKKRDKPRDSPAALTHGRWVPGIRGILHWRAS